MKNILFIILLFYISSVEFTGCTPKGNMPSFNLLLADSSSIFNTKDIPHGKPSIFVFFSPDCEHCQTETESILHKMDSLKNVQFYFITIDPIDRLRVFNGYYKIKRYSNILAGKDYTFFIPGHFAGAAPPFSMVYDKYKRLRGVFKGMTTASELINFINKM